MPARMVSAYEVYQAEQLDALHTRSCAEERGAAEDDDSGVVCRGSNNNDGILTSQTSTNASDAFSSDEVAVAKDVVHQRAVAVAWLRLTPSEKQRYEDAAQRWSREMASEKTQEDKQERLTPACAQAKSVNSTEKFAVPLLSVAADVPAEAAPTSSTAPPALSTALSAPQSTSQTATKKKSGVSSTSARGPGRMVTSFSLFRAEMKGNKWSIAKAAAVWQCMAPEEKHRYDAAAASYRTAGFRPPPSPLVASFLPSEAASPSDETPEAI